MIYKQTIPMHKKTKEEVRRRHSLKSLVAIVLSAGVLSCQPINPSPPGPDYNKVRQEIINLYSNWGSATQSKNYSQMKALSIPGSDFDQTGDFIKSKNESSGINNYYTFDSVSVPSLSEVGNYNLDSGYFNYYEAFPNDPSQYLYAGHTTVTRYSFIGSAKPSDGDFSGNNWKLDSFGNPRIVSGPTVIK